MAMETTKGTEAMKTAWPGHTLQALVEVKAKTQALKTRWQGQPAPGFGWNR